MKNGYFPFFYLGPGHGEVSPHRKDRPKGSATVMYISAKNHKRKSSNVGIVRLRTSVLCSVYSSARKNAILRIPRRYNVNLKAFSEFGKGSAAIGRNMLVIIV